MGNTYVRGLVPMLRVEDAGRSISFYRDALGFEVRDQLEEDGKAVWAYLVRGEAELMLSEQPGEVEVVRRAGAILYLYPDEVGAVQTRLAELNHPASQLRRTEYGMLEFDLLDPDGYELWLGQPTE